MKINVAVIGFGNLGKSVKENILKNDLFNLVEVFSKRKIEDAISYDTINDYKDKIDLLFVCKGSQNQLEDESFKLIQNFNIIESYDNHARLKDYITKLDKIATQNKKIALCSFGWDPGLFSLMRGLFDSLDVMPYTFWGKGLSQGHTQAIKSLPGVLDAIEFTIPNEKIIEKIKHGEIVENSKDFHKRECFVVAKKEDEKRIETEIKNMKDYFLGYQTTVNFVNQQKLRKIKTFSHRGCVLGKNEEMSFSLSLPSNPDFTARVLVAFAKNLTYLKNKRKFGAFTIFDLPFKNILKKDKFEYL